MTRLIKYELYKLINKKSIWIYILVIMSFLLFTYYYNDDTYVKNYTIKTQKLIQHQLYSDIQGTVTKEKIKKYEARKELFIKNPDKFQAIKDDFDQVDSIINWKVNNNKKIASITKIANSLASEKQYGYKYRSLLKQKSMLEKIKSPQIYMARGWIELFGCFQREFFSLLIIIIGLVTLFSQEYSLKTDSMILTSKYGKNKIVIAKLFSGIIYTSIIFTLFSLFYIVNNANTNILRGWNTPIQSITSISWYDQSTFQASPYSFTILQYLIVFLFLRLLACIAIAIFVIFISSIVKSSVTAFVISFAVVFIPNILVKFAKMGIIKGICDFSYYSLYAPGDSLKQYQAYNIFGMPVLRIDLLIAFYTVISILLVYATYIIYKKHQVLS